MMRRRHTIAPDDIFLVLVSRLSGGRRLVSRARIGRRLDRGRRNDPGVARDDFVLARQRDRRVAVCVDLHARERAFVDLDDIDRNNVAPVGGQTGIGEVGDAAGAVAVVSAEAAARIVEPSVGVLPVLEYGECAERVRSAGIVRRRPIDFGRLEAQVAGLRLIQHPGQRDMGEGIVGVPAADVGVHAGKPDLTDFLVGRQPLAGRAGLTGRSPFSHSFVSSHRIG